VTIYQEKARNLADELLLSEASKNYAHAFARLEEDLDNADTRERFLRARAEYRVLVEGVVGMIRTITGVDEVAGGGCGGCCGGGR